MFLLIIVSSYSYYYWNIHLSGTQALRCILYLVMMREKVDGNVIGICPCQS